MKILLSTLSFLMGIQFIHAQTYEIGFDAEVLKNYSVFKKGNVVHIDSMKHEIAFSEFDNTPQHSYTLFTSAGSVKVKEKLEDILSVKYKNAQDFWNAMAIFYVLEDLSNNGTQEEVRAEMESDVLEYINRVNRNRLAFNDPFLESYIYSLISKLSPNILIDGRPGVVNLLILSGTTANAFMFPNGTLVITTGLISLLHSEDELAAILAHEIAHFVLDHSIQNYNKLKRTQKRAEFWAEFATVLTGVSEGVAAAYNSYYKPGLATLSVAIASEQIAQEICKRLGMAYSRKQETAADEASKKLISVMGYDPNALSSALSRIETAMKQERSIEMYFASDHPALVERIKIAGTPSTKVDKNFERIISFAVSDAAFMKMQDRRFRQALPLVSQNIDNNVGTDDDYLQKANCLLYMRNDVNSYNEVTNLINEAKKIRPNNINIYKTEIIAFLRQTKYKEARVLLESYKSLLLTMFKNLEGIPEGEFQRRFIFAQSEMVWAEDMAQKLKAF
jgi:predicted Zn-dependent protease